MNDVVIVGAGKAGTRVAQELRALGFEGAITLFDSQPGQPYDRPPLSKGYLAGTQARESLNLLADDFCTSHDVVLRSGRRIVAIDRANKIVRDDAGSETAYATLVLATGARARPLPHDLEGRSGVHYLRTTADALALASALRPDCRLLIVGAGFIGLEVAAVASDRGYQVTVIEQAPTAMGRAVPAVLAEQVVAEHRRHGVEVLLGTAVETFPGEGPITSALLSDGRTLRCDAVLVGIGATPCCELANAAGLAVQDGIVVDADLRTADPAIYAVGDACRFPDSDGRLIRRESWRHADEQGKHVAAAIIQGGAPFRNLGYLWSDQYHLTLQVVGAFPSESLRITRALPDGALVEFALAHSGELLGASAWGRIDSIGKEIRAAEHLIRQGLRPAPEALGNPAVSLKSLLKK